MPEETGATISYFLAKAGIYAKMSAQFFRYNQRGSGMEREVIETDVLIVGGGPAGLSAAIHLSDLIRTHNEKVQKGEIKEASLAFNVLLIEKGSSFGSHSISGAVINPKTLKELLPDIPEKEMPFDSPVTHSDLFLLAGKQSFKLPFHPPYMDNRGYYVASLGKITRWLAGIAEKKGAQIFPGFTGHEPIYQKGCVAGIQTGDSGIDLHGKKKENYQPGTAVYSKLTILAEGARGHLTKQIVQKLGLDRNRNPQIYSAGVKELWEVPPGTLEPGRVIHTMGYPLGFDQFGGGFIYGLSGNLVALGLVVGLDYKDPTFDPHRAFQTYKQHPFVTKFLEKGKMLRYGAKALPEGGLFSMPQFYHDGLMIVGDSASFLSMPSLKGIHLGIESGMLAAKTAFEALRKGDYSKNQLALYETLFKKSSAYKDLRPVRNFRQGFKRNLFFGAVHFAAQLITGGWGLSPAGRLKIGEDCRHLRKLSPKKREAVRNLPDFDKKLTFDKATDVFFSGTQHDEDQPCHLIVPDPDLCRNVCIPTHGGPCQYFCPAEVYEIVTDPKTGKKDLHLHPTNCVHCKTCDIKDPFKNITWVTPCGGDGPEYEIL